MKMIYTPSGELVEVENIYYGVAKIRYSDDTRVNVPENLLKEAPEEISQRLTAIESIWEKHIAKVPKSAIVQRWCPNCENSWAEPSSSYSANCPYCAKLI